MAVTYLRLFDPTQQFQLKNGALNVSGRLFVYLEGTDDLAALYDENGTQLSQPVVLDNNGRATGLFVDSKKVYRLQVNDQYGELLFTIRKMAPCGGGAGSALGTTYNVISSDGTIEVTPYDDNGTRVFDLSNSNAQELQYVRTDSFTLSTLTVDNTCVLTPTHRVDGNMDVDANGIKLTGGVIYNVSVYIHMEASDPNVNRFDGVKFRLFANDAPYAEYTFSESYDHKQVACISCDIHPESDTYFKVYVENLANGTILTCNQCTIHSVASSYVVNAGGGGGDYTASAPISIANNVISLLYGTGLTVDANDQLTIDFDVVQHKLTVGPNVDIINNVLSTEKTVVAAGQNVTVTSSLDNVTRTRTYTVSASGGTGEQVQSDWDVTDTSSPAYIKNKPTLSTVATTGDYDDLINKPTIPAAQVQSDWAQSSSSSVDYIKNKPTLSTVATSGDYDDLINKPTIPAEQVQSNWNETNTSSKAYIQNKPDLSEYQPKLTAGDNITINNVTNTISATDTNTHRPIQLEGSQILGDNTDPLNIVAGSNVTISNSNGTVTISATGGGQITQVQSDWAQTNNAQVDYIKNKPDTKPLTAGTGIAITELVDQVLIAATAEAQVQSNWTESNSSSPAYIWNKPTIPAEQVQSNWNETDTSSKAYIQNKPSVPNVGYMWF